MSNSILFSLCVPLCTRWSNRNGHDKWLTYFNFSSCLAVIVVGAFVIRAWNLSAQPLGMDELAEMQVRSQTFVEAATRADSMPPLYPLLLKAWSTVWPSDIAGRWLSVAMGVATVAVVATLWARCVGPPLALIVAALLAIAPLHVYYSQYVRSYVFLFFWSAVTLGALAAAVKSNRKSDWLLFAIGSLGGLYTHYYFAIFWIVMALLGGWCSGRWRPSRPWWVTCVSIGLLALPLIGFVQSDLNYQKSLRDARPMNVAAFGYTYLSMATGYCIGPSKTELQQISAREAMVSGAPISAVVGFIFLSLGGWGAVALRRQRLLLPVLVLVFVPVFAIGLLGRVAGVTYNPRFVVWSLPPLLLLLAAGILEGRRSWIVRAGMLTLVLVSSLAIYNRQSVARYQNEDVRSLGVYLTTQTAEQAPVFVVANYMTDLVAHYLPNEWSVGGLPDPDDEALSSDSTSEVDHAFDALVDELPSGGSYWLVYTRPFHGDPEGKLLSRLRNEGTIEKREAFTGIVLYRGRLDSR